MIQSLTPIHEGDSNRVRSIVIVTSARHTTMSRNLVFCHATQEAALPLFGLITAKANSMGVFDWASSVTYVLTDWTFLTILYSTGTGMKPCEIRKNGRWTQRYCVSNVSTTIVTGSVCSCLIKATLSSESHQLQCMTLQHFKLYIFNSI